MTPALKRMSEAEFLEWCQHQEGRWELVGGLPVLVMTGANQRHDRLVRNMFRALEDRLEGGLYELWTHRIASRMTSGNI